MFEIASLYLIHSIVIIIIIIVLQLKMFNRWDIHNKILKNA